MMRAKESVEKSSVSDMSKNLEQITTSAIEDVENQAPMNIEITTPVVAKEIRKKLLRRWVLFCLTYMCTCY